MGFYYAGNKKEIYNNITEEVGRGTEFHSGCSGAAAGWQNNRFAADCSGMAGTKPDGDR